MTFHQHHTGDGVVISMPETAMEESGPQVVAQFGAKKQVLPLPLAAKPSMNFHSPPRMKKREPPLRS